MGRTLDPFNRPIYM